MGEPIEGRWPCWTCGTAIILCGGIGDHCCENCDHPTPALAPTTDDCGARHPDHPGTRCRQPDGHRGEHMTARRDVTWDNAWLSTPTTEEASDG